MSTLPERTFGVELEVVGITQYEARRLLRSLKLPVYDTCSESWACECETCAPEPEGKPYSKWTVKSDCSIEAPAGHGSCEIVSPVLSGKDGLRQLKKVCQALVDVGVFVNQSCGLHIHIGASDLTGNELFSVIQRYARWEGEFDKMMHHTRRGRGNGYASTLAHHEESIQDFDYRIRKGDSLTVSKIVNRFYDRYYKVNLGEAMDKCGTIEFRQHNGAINPETVCNWAEFMLYFFRRSCELVNNLDLRDEGPFDGVPEHLAAFYQERQGFSPSVPFEVYT
jgi:hypothetical protein